MFYEMIHCLFLFYFHFCVNFIYRHLMQFAGKLYYFKYINYDTNDILIIQDNSPNMLTIILLFC